MSIWDGLDKADWDVAVEGAESKLAAELAELLVELPVNTQWAAVTGFEGAMEALGELGYSLVRNPKHIEGA